MSLSLLQSYSSAEEEEEEAAAQHGQIHYRGSSDDEDDGDVHVKNHSAPPKRYDSSVFDFPDPSHKSALPSAFDAFSQCSFKFLSSSSSFVCYCSGIDLILLSRWFLEISGPPEFLTHAVVQVTETRDLDPQQGRRGGQRDFKDKKAKPAGAVVEAKAQLVGIHERVRSDIEGIKPPTLVPSITQDGTKRVASATNPNAEDAAELLRMCLQCGIPKTYSSGRGMVCPVCGDRPVADPDKETKKKGSTMKDKEKSKRMKGQSSHATWKSETEMQLRQQFD
ncbi:hypothetical protein CCACVL1_04102 [Corchorus capsularis]|uniref:Uncharacterized protein n=1 Tax=Corchorus capsularis TaxID=210143 RepID=A0A1R3JV75_COCAP|nr:hypothetical protein CCACVL1_04102 [Corchorus capsularis]